MYTPAEHSLPNSVKCEIPDFKEEPLSHYFFKVLEHTTQVIWLFSNSNDLVFFNHKSGPIACKEALLLGSHVQIISWQEVDKGSCHTLPAIDQTDGL